MPETLSHRNSECLSPYHHSPQCQVQDLIKDFSDKNDRLATVRAVKHHCQYLSQLKSIAEGRGVSLLSDTGMGAIMRSVLVGCVQIDNPDAAARTHSRALAACPRNAGNVWACREHLRVGPVWGLSREEASANPAPPEVTFPSPAPWRCRLLPHSDCHPLLCICYPNAG